MMRVLMINEICGYTSTGRICGEIADKLSSDGNEVKIAYGRSSYVPEKYKKYAVRIGTDWDVKKHAIMVRILDTCGFGSTRATKDFLQWADGYDPDLVWLHNLHGYFINIEVLFAWLKKREKQIRIKWTFHDCWPFTGHCTYFTVCGCDRWKTGCYKCPQKRKYPKSIFTDNCRNNYAKKKKIFSGVNNLEIIVPSKWLADIVSHSFFSSYPIKIEYNKINKDIFRPVSSDFKQKYNIKDKKIILGVANVWSEGKGLKDFVELNRMLDRKSYVIVLIGLSRKQIRKIPDGMIGIERIEGDSELAGIYSSSDIFVNPSKEETFGMTTLEAISCGTKVIVYKNTACEEVLAISGNYGIAVEPGVDNIKNAIQELIGKCAQT